MFSCLPKERGMFCTSEVLWSINTMIVCHNNIWQEANEIATTCLTDHPSLQFDGTGIFTTVDSTKDARLAKETNSANKLIQVQPELPDHKIPYKAIIKKSDSPFQQDNAYLTHETGGNRAGDFRGALWCGLWRWTIWLFLFPIFHEKYSATLQSSGRRKELHVHNGRLLWSPQKSTELACMNRMRNDAISVAVFLPDIFFKEPKYFHALLEVNSEEAKMGD